MCEFSMTRINTHTQIKQKFWHHLEDSIRNIFVPQIDKKQKSLYKIDLKDKVKLFYDKLIVKDKNKICRKIFKSIYTTIF